MNTDLIKLRYQQTCEIWQNMCHLHKSLFDLTCDEYLALLKSDLDLLDSIVAQKDLLIEEINELDQIRRTHIATINNEGHLASTVNDATTLIAEFSKLEESPLLPKLNLLLLDLINSIRSQNKKNQLFLNKALQSLKDIKETFAGKKNFSSYGPKGNAEKLSVR